MITRIIRLELRDAIQALKVLGDGSKNAKRQISELEQATAELKRAEVEQASAGRLAAQSLEQRAKAATLATRAQEALSRGNHAQQAQLAAQSELALARATEAEANAQKTAAAAEARREKALDRVDREQREATKSATGLTRALGGLGGVVGVVAGLTAGVFSLHAGFAELGRSVHASLAFGDDLKKIETLVGVQPELVAEWRDEILSLGPAVGVLPEKLVPALFQISSGGERGAEALRILEQSAKATALGLGETADIGKLATAAYQAYGDAAFEAVDPIDILGAAIREGQLDTAGLADVMGRAIPIAASLGVSFDELGGFVATFSRLGIKAEESITAVRGVLATVQKPSKGAEEALAGVGLSVDELRRSIDERGLARTLVDLVQLFGDNTSALAEVVPNVEALTGVLGTAGIFGEEFVEISGRVAGAAGFISDEFSKLGDEPAQRMRQLQAEVSALRIKVGDELVAVLMSGLLPAVHDVLESTGEWVTNNNDLLQSIGAVVSGVLEDLLAALGFVAKHWKLLGVAMAALNWSAVVAGINAVTVAMRANPLFAGAVAVTALLAIAEVVEELSARWQRAIDRMTASSRRHWQEVDEVTAAINSQNEATQRQLLTKYAVQQADAAFELSQAWFAAAAAQKALNEAQARASAAHGRHARQYVEAMRDVERYAAALEEAQRAQGAATATDRSASEAVARLLEALGKLPPAARAAGSGFNLMGDAADAASKKLAQLQDKLRESLAEEQAKAIADLMDRYVTFLGFQERSITFQEILNTAIGLGLDPLKFINGQYSQEITLQVQLLTLKEKIREKTLDVAEATEAVKRKWEESDAAAAAALQTMIDAGQEIGERTRAGLEGDPTFDENLFGPTAAMTEEQNRIAREGLSEQIRLWTEIGSTAQGVIADLGSAFGAFTGEALAGLQQLGSSLGNLDLSGGSGGGSGAMLAAAGGFVAVMVAMYEGFNAMNERRSNRRFSYEADIAYSSAGYTGAAADRDPRVRDDGFDQTTLWNNLRDAIDNFRIAMGGVLTWMPSLRVQVRQDGEEIRVLVGGEIIGIFKTMEEALREGLRLALSAADWGELGPNMTAALEALGGLSNVDAEMLLPLLPRLQELDNIAAGMSPALARAAVAWNQQLAALDVESERLLEVGVSLETVLEMREREIDLMRRQVEASGLMLVGLDLGIGAFEDWAASAAGFNAALESEAARRDQLARQPPAGYGDAAGGVVVGPGGGGGGGRGSTGAGTDQSLVPGGVIKFSAAVTDADDAAAGAATSVDLSSRAFDGHSKSVVDFGAAAEGATSSIGSFGEGVSDYTTTANDAADATQGVSQAFIESIGLLFSLGQQISETERILSIADKYGIQLENRAALEQSLADMQFAKDVLELEMLYQQLVLAQEILNISNATLTQWRAAIDEIAAAPHPTAPRGGAGGRQRRDERERIQAEVDAILAAAAGVSDVAAAMSRDIGEIRDFAAEMRKLRFPAEEVLEVIRAQLELLTRDFLANDRETILQHQETEFETSFRHLAEGFGDRLEAAATLAQERAAAFGTTFEEEFASILATMGEAFNISSLDMIQSEIERLTREGDVEGLERLRTFLENLGALDFLPPEALAALGDFGALMELIAEAIAAAGEAAGGATSAAGEYTAAIEAEIAARQEALALLEEEIAARRRANAGQRDFLGQIREIEAAYDDLERQARETIDNTHALTLTLLELAKMEGEEVFGVVKGFLGYLQGLGYELPVEVVQALAIAELEQARASILLMLSSESARNALAGLGFDLAHLGDDLNAFIDRAEADVLTGAGPGPGRRPPPAADPRSAAARGPVPPPPPAPQTDRIAEEIADLFSQFADAGIAASLRNARELVADRDRLLALLEEAGRQDEIDAALEGFAGARGVFVDELLVPFQDAGIDAATRQFTGLREGLLEAVAALQEVGASTDEWAQFLAAGQGALDAFVDDLKSGAIAELDELRSLRTTQGDQRADLVAGFQEAVQRAQGGDLAAFQEATDLSRRLRGLTGGLAGGELSAFLRVLEAGNQAIVDIEGPDIQRDILGTANEQLDVAQEQLEVMRSLEASLARPPVPIAFAVAPAPGSSEISVRVAPDAGLVDEIGRLRAEVVHLRQTVEQSARGNASTVATTVSGAVRDQTKELKAALRPRGVNT